MCGTCFSQLKIRGQVEEPIHKMFVSNNVPPVENSANLGKLSIRRAPFETLPLKIENGSGSALRTCALTQLSNGEQCSSDA